MAVPLFRIHCRVYFRPKLCSSSPDGFAMPRLSWFHIDRPKYKFCTHRRALGGLQTFASREPGTMTEQAWLPKLQAILELCTHVNFGLVYVGPSIWNFVAVKLLPGHSNFDHIRQLESGIEKFTEKYNETRIVCTSPSQWAFLPSRTGLSRV
jgi:hypothetical protein